jgi:hypothetical protein
MKRAGLRSASLSKIFGRGIPDMFYDRVLN